MYSDYSFANAIILFGAFQGILLLFFLFRKRQGNLPAYWFFSLFVFSLAYVNLWYGLHFMEIYSIGHISISAIFYPYEFLLGIGFYFYIKSLKKVNPPFYKKEIYLFFPAIIYCILEMYWVIIRFREGSPRIYLELENIGFFAAIEYIRFSFNLILGLLAIYYLNTIKKQDQLSAKEKKHIQWLFLLSSVFLCYNILSIILTGLTFIPNNFSLIAFYLTFFINTTFLYWLGYIGYTKPNTLFTIINSTAKHPNQEKHNLIEERLIQIMEVEEEFRHSDFSLSKLALLSKISNKELSDHINNIHKCNVSTYINRYRVEKVKAILDSSDFEYYTLEAIAREAGFKSKSSFNSIFKKHTTLTPSQYRSRG